MNVWFYRASDPPAHTSEAEPDAALLATETDPQPDRSRPRSTDAIEEAARALYTERKDNPPNVLEAERLIRKRLPGATRNRIREVLNKSEFKGLRSPAGKPSQNLPS